MINTTVKVVSTDGAHSAEETVIVQSAGDMDMEGDVNAHKNSFSAMIGSVEHAVEVTLERIQDQIEDERPKPPEQPAPPAPAKEAEDEGKEARE
jgi:hypothetical protein